MTLDMERYLKILVCLNDCQYWTASFDEIYDSTNNINLKKDLEALSSKGLIVSNNNRKRRKGHKRIHKILCAMLNGKPCACTITKSGIDSYTITGWGMSFMDIDALTFLFKR